MKENLKYIADFVKEQIRMVESQITCSSREEISSEMCSLGWAFIVDSREGSVAGLLTMHLVSCGVVVLQSVFSIVHVYTSEKSIYWFVKTVLSSSSRHSELVLNESALITALCAMLCVLDMMKSL